MEVAVKRKALRREFGIGQYIDIDRIVDPQNLKGIDAQICFDPRGFGQCIAESPHGNVVREVESPRPCAGKIAVQIAFKAKIGTVGKIGRLGARIGSTAGKAKIGGDTEGLQARVQERPIARVVIKPVGHGDANIHAAVGFERRAGAKRTPFLPRRVKIVPG